MIIKDLDRFAFDAIRELAAKATLPLLEERVVDGQSTPHVFGTCCLFDIDGVLVLVTAKHVADDIDRLGLGVPTGVLGMEVWTLGAGQLTKAEDRDVVVFRVDDPESARRLRLRWVPLTLDDTWTGTVPQDVLFFLFGYPDELTVAAGDALDNPSAAYVTSRYNRVPTGLSTPYDPAADLMLTYMEEAIEPRTGRSIRVPDLPGISGCSVWAVPDPRRNQDVLWNVHTSARIVAVESSYNPDAGWIRTRRWSIVQRLIASL